MVKISAKIIVFNEEENIADLCETVSWADEIVIVDSSSSDQTVEIARKYTDKIFDREFKGYKDKHVFADSKTSNEWIFWIDADERVTPELRESILALKDRAPESLPDGFAMSRKTWYLGRWIKHSGWYPDVKMRLYRTDKSYWDGVSPHETARVDGKVEMLEGELLHYTKKKLSEHHLVLDSYTTLAAEFHRKNNREVGGFGIFFNPIFAFLKSYVVKQGFRDGVPGLIIAMFNAYSVFLKYAKIWEEKNVSE